MTNDRPYRKAIALDPDTQLAERARTARGRIAQHGFRSKAVGALRPDAMMYCLSAIETLEAVSELLGHTTIRITGDVYGHVSPEVARAAMDSLSESLELPTD